MDLLPSAGLEPAATRLKGERSTTELRRLNYKFSTFPCLHICVNLGRSSPYNIRVGLQKSATKYNRK